MKLENKTHQISLASIFICVFTLQIQAGSWDDIKNKATNAAKQVMDETVQEVDGNTSAQQEPAETISNQKKAPHVKAQESAEYVLSEKRKHDFDIVGLKLGMTSDQVVKALNSHNKDVQIQYTRFEHKPVPAAIAHLVSPNLPEHLQMIFASVNGNAESITIEFAEPPSDNVVRRIERMNKFDRNAMPSTDNVTSALKNKYGPPTDAEEWALAWNYSKSPDANRRKHCIASVKGAAKSKKSVQADCGLALTALMGRADDDVVGWMQTLLVDYQELDRQTLATNNLRTEMSNQRSQQNQQNANQNSAPKL